MKGNAARVRPQPLESSDWFSTPSTYPGIRETSNAGVGEDPWGFHPIGLGPSKARLEGALGGGTWNTGVLKIGTKLLKAGEGRLGSCRGRGRSEAGHRPETQL